jgi:hypothetical protein
LNWRLRELIWNKLCGNPDTEEALGKVKNEQEADLPDIRTYLKAAMSRDLEFAGQVQAINW